MIHDGCRSQVPYLCRGLALIEMEWGMGMMEIRAAKNGGLFFESWKTWEMECRLKEDRDNVLKRSCLESEGESARKHSKEYKWENGRRSEHQTENMPVSIL